jgi:hypothetical protein
METHIDKFSALQQEVDYHRPASIPPIIPAQINFTFIRTLGETWFTFQQAISTRIHTMKTAELYAEVKVADKSEHLDDKTPVYRANFTTRGGKGGVSRITAKTMNLDQPHFNGGQTLRLVQRLFPILN